MQQPPPPRSVECIQRRYFGVKRHSAPPPQHYHQRSPIRPQYPVSTQAQAQVQAQAQIRQRRPYHSHFQSVFPTTHEYTHSQTAILSTALEHVPEHGFTLEALTLGARDAGFLDVSVQLFSRREFDLVLFWLASRRGLLKGKVEEEEEEGLFDKSRLSVDEKVKVLVMQRLRMNEKIVHRWQDVRIYLFIYLFFFF
jgi:ubiquinone biosynthesis protein COQ9